MAPEMGWGDLDNGDLLDAMGGRFDALVTVDNRLPQQRPFLRWRGNIPFIGRGAPLLLAATRKQSDGCRRVARQGSEIARAGGGVKAQRVVARRRGRPHDPGVR